jgi:cell division protein FtsN
VVLGLGLGVSAVLVTQLVSKRWGSQDGLAGLVQSAARPKPVEEKKAEASSAPSARPKLDFYTVLPEMETVLPDRSLRSARTAKSEKAEEGVRFVLQAGSFASFSDADQLKARLALQGLVAHVQKVTIEGRGDFHRVRLGPYERVEQLDTADQQLRALGVKPIRLKLKPGAAG